MLLGVPVASGDELVANQVIGLPGPEVRIALPEPAAGLGIDGVVVHTHSELHQTR